MTTIDCPDHLRLSAFYDGSLTTVAHLQVARHIRDCPQCQKRSTEAGLPIPTRRSYPDPSEAPTQSPDTSDLTPDGSPQVDRIGQYEIRRLIGRGGMGAVYEAIHSRLGRSVAIKVLPRPVAVDPEYQIRFEREVRAVGKLDHPNVVRATDAGVMDGVPYLVMELVDGVDLARMVRSIGPLPIADACEIVRQAAEGLTHAHRKGIVHRDVKPSNLMVTAVGVVKVLDMGLAIFVSHMDQISERITGPTVLGTHDYMAPEQWLDPGVVSEKVDIYGLGCVLFQTLVGQPPFSGIEFESPHAKKRAHINTPPPNVATIRQEVPGPLAHLIRRMLAKKPEDRPTCNELADTLKTFIPSPPLLVRQVERTRLAPSTGFTDGNPTALAPVGADPALSPTVDGLNQITSRTPLPDINGDPNRIRAWEFTVALTLLIIMMLFGMVALVSGMFQ